jgi:hypothetical protein
MLGKPSFSTAASLPPWLYLSSFLIRYQATNQHARFSAGGFAFHKQNKQENLKRSPNTQKNCFKFKENKGLFAYL